MGKALESDLVWIVVDRHVVTMQHQTGFKPKYVSGTQTSRHHAFSLKCVPHLINTICRRHNFESILAGVSSARDSARYPCNLRPANPEWTNR